MTILIFLVCLFGAIAIGIPIAYALLLSGIGLMFYMMDMVQAQMIAQSVINGANSFPLLAVPFFMLAGELMNAGGLSKRIIDLALSMVGHKRGGLGFVAIFAGAIMAALSGSAVADTAALTALLLPMMIAAGYEKNRSAGLLASSGIIASVIPPSIALVIYGVTANQSITKLFLAGIVPGIFMAVGLSVVWYIVSIRYQGVTRKKSSRREVFVAFKRSAWALMLPLIIIFGLRFGIFTPTEAAVVAAVYAFFVAVFIYKELSMRELYKVLVSSSKTTAVIMFLVATAMVSAKMITLAELPFMLIDLLEPLIEHKTLLLIVIMLVILVIGMVMDMTPVILIMTPVLAPIITAAQIDPIYFGILFVMNCSIGLLLPPVGTVLNVVCSVGKIKMEEGVKGILPFLLVEIVVLFLLVIFPDLVMIPAGWFY